MIRTKKRTNPSESARLLFYYNEMITLQLLRHSSETKGYDALLVHPTLASNLPLATSQQTAASAIRLTDVAFSLPQ